ncbi:MAG TPA: ATP-binding protein [Acidimicrobiales bacterium]|nr:ATP-binding protein [Acidimicrobiales bacterium]
MTSVADLFDAVIELPDRIAQRRYAALVGLDDVKSRLGKEARLLLDPGSLEKWSKDQHGGRIAACDAFADRAPMFLFAGDVGTGKTALAETFGDEIARGLDLPVLLYRLSLSSRGSGAVGEMTQLLATAFDEVRRAAGHPDRGGRHSSAVILLIDEADALAQSRETAQMHHEDRAGVNALIRGVNSLSEQGLPVVVVLATNRLGAIDPAVRRRAAATFDFDRPNDDQRRVALVRLLEGVPLDSGELDALVAMTGPVDDRDYGYTYSDLYQRLVPAAVLTAYPDRPLSVDLLLTTVGTVEPTPPFRSMER